MYEHDAEDLEIFGWEEFVLRQWASIFEGYRASVGLRAVCRRWSDLIEAGIGCSQDIADLLVRAELIDGIDRDLEGTRNVAELLAGMADLLADLGPALSELPIAPDELVRLREQHAELVDVLVAAVASD